VMIIAMPAGIIDTTYIKHGLQRIKDLEWSSTSKRQTSKCREGYTRWQIMCWMFTVPCTTDTS
jgi:hypothetical protein